MVLHKLGFWVYGYRNFSSRIKGGYSSHEITFGEEPARVKKNKNDILICLAKEGWDRDLQNLSESGIALVDEDILGETVERIMGFPFKKKAKEGPGEIYKWVMALGTLCNYLGISDTIFEGVIEEYFISKGQKVADNNLTAFEEGQKLYQGNNGLPRILPFTFEYKGGLSERRLTKGSDAVAESALSAGCSFISGYPISPASEVFEYLALEFKDDKGNAIQTEDEIAAIDMAIGASYGGATAMVSTSGPGFSLMAEGIGLSYMTEVPVVVVNAQRSGPSTGMPTKHEQSDIDFALTGGHGDLMPLVFCPSSVEEIYEDLPRAFFMAEKHRIPVIFLTDFAMMLSRASIKDVKPLKVPMENIKKDRIVPGMEGKMFHRTANQFGDNGLPTDLPHIRNKMVERRLADFPKEMEDSFTYIEDGDDLLIIATGSTRGAVEIVQQNLKGRISALYPRVLSPFPLEALGTILKKFEKILVLDNNIKGQILNLLKKNYDFHYKFDSLRRFDGEPFGTIEIMKKVMEVVNGG